MYKCGLTALCLDLCLDGVVVEQAKGRKEKNGLAKGEEVMV
jgi:hypothetical protein